MAPINNLDIKCSRGHTDEGRANYTISRHIWPVIADKGIRRTPSSLSSFEAMMVRLLIHGKPR